MAITAEKLMVEVGGDTSGAQKALKDLESEGSKIPGWVNGAKGSLLGLFGVGVGAGAAFTAGLLGNVSAMDANAKVTAELGLTETESDRIGAVAGSMFANAYGDSIGEVNDAVASVVSSVDGMRTASAPILQSATQDVLNFAKTFEVDVDKAAQIAGQAVRQGLAPDFQTAMDLMTTASQQVPKALRGDLIDAVDEYGGFFTALGMSGEEGFAALTRGAQEGMYGIDKTGDALKELTIRATDGSKTSVAAYDAMGLSSTDMAAQMLAGGDTARGAFDQIVSGLLGITDPQERANAAIALMGTPLEDLGTSEIPLFLESLQGLQDGLGDTAGSAAQMGEDLNSGPGVALETFKRRIQDAFMGITDWAIPPLLALGDTVSGAVGPALEGLSSWVTGTGIPALQSFATWVQTNADTITTVATVIGAVLLPVFVSMAVGATISAATQVVAWVSTAAGAVASVATQTLAHYKNVAGWVMSAAAAVASGAETAVIWLMLTAEAIAGAAAQTLAQARVAAAWLMASAASALEGAKMVASMVITSAGVVLGWVTMGAQAALGAAQVVAGWVLAGITTLVQGAIMVGSMIATAASVVGGWVVMAAGAMIGAVQMAAAWFIALGPIGWVIAAVIAVAALVIANWDTISAATSAAWTAIVGWVTAAWASIVSWVTGAVENVRAVISAVFAAIVTIITAYVNAWKAVIQAVWGAIQAIVSGAIAGVQGAISGLADIAGKVGGWFGSAKDAISDKLGQAVSFVAGIPGKIIAALGAVGSMLYASGSSIIQGLIDGISGAAGKVKAAVEGVLKKARDLLPFSPAKEGPFSGKGWTLYSGQAISASLAKGITDNTNQVKAAALGMMNAAQIDLGGVTGTPSVRLNGNPVKGRTTTAELGVSQADDGGPRTLTIVDTDGTLIGRMQVEAGRVQTRQVTPLDHGMASW